MPLLELDELFDEQVSGTRITRAWLGRGTDPRESAAAIKASDMCPKEGQQDYYNTSFVYDDVRVERHVKDEPGVWWKITTSAVRETPATPDPTQEAAKIRLKSSQYSTYTYVDREGKLITNTAGDPVLMAKEDSRWVFSVSKNVSSLPAWILDYNNALNNGLVTIKGLSCQKETLMCKGMRLSDDRTVTVAGREVTYSILSFELHFRPEGWKGTHPNVGVNQLIEENVPSVDRFTGKVRRDSNNKIVWVKKKRRVPITNNGIPVETLQVLDADGAWVEEPSPDDLLQIEADVYKTKNFGQLPLR